MLNKTGRLTYGVKIKDQGSGNDMKGTQGGF